MDEVAKVVFGKLENSKAVKKAAQKTVKKAVKKTAKRAIKKAVKTKRSKRR